MIVYEQIFKKYGLSTTQQEIIKLVGQNKIVLEIGSSTGYMTKAFLDNACTVDVVEFDKEAIPRLPKKIRHVFNTSIENDTVYNKLGKFDFVILADVLEHLVNPENVLKKLLSVANSKTKIIISLPNVACWAMRKQLFFKGDFQYQESGLLDRTHMHFYTVNSLPKLLKETGWRVDKILGTITRVPFEGLTGRIPLLYSWFVRKYRNLAYYHFVTIASKK